MSKHMMLDPGQVAIAQLDGTVEILEFSDVLIIRSGGNSAEITAMGKIERTMHAIPEGARWRIARWVSDKWGQ